MAAFEAAGEPGVRRFEPRNFVYLDFPGLKGFLNRQGQVAIEPSFAEVGPFRDGLAVAVLDGYCHIATPNGGREGSPTSGYPTSCGGAPADAIAPCRAGFIDRSGRFAIEARFDAAQDFQEKLAAVRIDGLWGFIDATGAIVIPPRFEQVQSFSEGLAAVKIGDKWGFVDPSGLIAIPPTFDEVQQFSDSRALVYSNRGAFYIDKQGRTAIPGPFKEATPFVNGLAAVLLSDTHVAYIDHAGKTVFQYRRRR
ncbi:MAG: WG repeat-containing protein [Bryobacterales bacterium]|nr:WG repeat-containing protein [Bryobacterales bacterium]